MGQRRGLAITVGLCAAALLATTSVLAASTTAVPKCDGVRLRTGPSTAYATRLIIDRGTRVTVVAEVNGAAWSTFCGGSSYSGSKWAQINAVNGATVKSRFGIDYLYAAAGLLRDLGPVATPAAPSPTSRPSVTPTAAPAATPVPTATSEPSTSASAPPSAEASVPSVESSGASPSALAGGLTGRGAGPMSDTGLAVEIAILVLALVSVLLTSIVYRQRRRRDRHSLLSKVPPSRLDDARS